VFINFNIHSFVHIVQNFKRLKPSYIYTWYVSVALTSKRLCILSTYFDCVVSKL